MAAILTSNASVIAAENFITSIYDNDTNLYMGVGQGYQEGDTYSGVFTFLFFTVFLYSSMNETMIWLT